MKLKVNTPERTFRVQIGHLSLSMEFEKNLEYMTKETKKVFLKLPDRTINLKISATVKPEIIKTTIICKDIISEKSRKSKSFTIYGWNQEELKEFFINNI